MKEIARYLLTLGPPTTSASVVLDNACGPGIVTGEILNLPQSMRPAQIHAADFSPKMIEALRAKCDQTRPDGKLWQAVRPLVLDAEDLNAYGDNMFSHSFMNFALFLLPNPEKGIAEIYRTLAPGTGKAFVTTWAELGYLYVFQNAQLVVKPDAPVFRGPLNPEWMTEAKLRSVMEAGGFNPSKINISRTTSWLDMSEWSTGLKTMSNALKSMITTGWTDREKDLFSMELQKCLHKARNDQIEMKAWIAVATK